MEKLMISKAIMDKSDSIKKVGNGGLPPTSLQQFDIPEAKFNIPQEFMSETKTPSRLPADRPMKTPTVEAIKNSRLPDEIKKLMIEHPINQPASTNQNEISHELANKAARLMNTKANGEMMTETTNKNKTTTSFNGDIKEMIREAVREVLSENGLLAESSTKSNETFSFKVGKHIFEGKVTKIKKIS